jgi:Kef-type K+ transport system membrane component KefB
MPDLSFSSLAVVLAVAFFTPLALGLVPRLRVPSVVVEIVLGIVIGPAILDWARPDQVVKTLSSTIGSDGAAAAGLLQATSLPFIVASTAIGVSLGLITPATSAAFVAAGLASALFFPVAALTFLRRADRPLSTRGTEGAVVDPVR